VVIDLCLIYWFDVVATAAAVAAVAALNRLLKRL